MQTTLTLLGLLALSFAADLPTTPMISDNVPGTSYTAEFTGKQGITGFVTVSANTNGTGSVINVALGGLPDQSAGGPFLYHIHTSPVAANGSCATALAHLDPSARGEQPPCDAKNPAMCQAGDLAGKYGKMTTSPWQQVYVDLFTSTTPGNAAFVGNRSIVVHLANTTRIACANFKPVSVPAGSAVCSSGAPASSAAPLYPTTAAAGAASPTGAAGAGSATSSGAASIASGTKAPSPPITASNGAGVTGMSLGALALAAAAFVL